MAILGLSYFWTYIFGSFFSFILMRHYTRFRGESETYKTAIGLVGYTCDIAKYVFLILGFWFMPKWWYPFIFFIASFALSGIPIPDWILSLIGIIAAPLLLTLSYIFMFQ